MFERSRTAAAAGLLSALLLASVLTGCSSGTQESASTEIEGADELGAVEVVAREEGSGTRAVFSEQVGLIETADDGTEVDVTTESATIANSAEVVIDAVSASDSAIGYVSLGSLSANDGVKVVSIDGVEPSTATVEDGSYSLSRDFLIASVDDATDVEADFLDYITSAGQEIVEEEGYVAVQDTGRFLSDKSEGFITISGSTSVSPLMEALADAYGEENPNAAITVTATDSTTGLNAAMSQESDWGMSSRELESYESELLDTTVIARDAVAVIVSDSSPVTSLSTDELRQLFSGEAADWSDLN